MCLFYTSYAILNLAEKSENSSEPCLMESSVRRENSIRLPRSGAVVSFHTGTLVSLLILIDNAHCGCTSINTPCWLNTNESILWTAAYPSSTCIQIFKLDIYNAHNWVSSEVVDMLHHCKDDFRFDPSKYLGFICFILYY